MSTLDTSTALRDKRYRVMTRRALSFISQLRTWLDFYWTVDDVKVGKLNITKRKITEKFYGSWVNKGRRDHIVPFSLIVAVDLLKNRIHISFLSSDFSIRKSFVQAVIDEWGGKPASTNYQNAGYAQVTYSII